MEYNEMLVEKACIRKFKAYWVVDGKEIRIIPNRKTSSRFATIKEATKRLEKLARFYPINTRGIVRDWLNNEVLTISL